MNIEFIKEIIQTLITAIIALSGVLLQANISKKNLKQSKNMEQIYKLADERKDKYMYLHDNLVHYKRMYMNVDSSILCQNNQKEDINIEKMFEHINLDFDFREIYYDKDTIYNFNEIKHLTKQLIDYINTCNANEKEIDSLVFGDYKEKIIKNIDECLNSIKDSIGLSKINNYINYM